MGKEVEHGGGRWENGKELGEGKRESRREKEGWRR